MSIQERFDQIWSASIQQDNHLASDYFKALRLLVEERNRARSEEASIAWQRAIDRVYTLVEEEIRTTTTPPRTPVCFGTSGWRGILGKDLNLQSVAFVTAAILKMYQDCATDKALAEALGVQDFTEMQRRGCVLGFDNRFAGPLLARAALRVLTRNGVRVLYAGEATTGCLSASVLRQKVAFSINLTPSHNPLEYGGFKFNAADGGPAATLVTDTITRQARQLFTQGSCPLVPADLALPPAPDHIIAEDALASWQALVRANTHLHGIQYDQVLSELARRKDIVVCIDSVHGASRISLSRLLANPPTDRLLLLRHTADPTFGGIAPEPSSANMQPVLKTLAERSEPLKIGAIIDPDGDRIRFTDGEVEISMNQFGAMAYHFLHQDKGKQGMVAKTVASSNLANAVAKALGEEVFEPRVGFKEFKPVIGKALVLFEESDGISVIGHTPEKDAFIGLILALDMVLSRNQSLGAYLEEIENLYGHYYPDRDGVNVAKQGQELLAALAHLERYAPGSLVQVGEKTKRIDQVITIDGRKMILEDGSWIMVRPSGTEPKVRFYVEARQATETALLVDSAKSMLAEIGLLP
jgi:phosphomannomutase